MNKRPFASPDWRRDLRTFAAGAGCGFLGGALLVGTVLWQYHWITPPWSEIPLVKWSACTRR